MTYLVLAKHEGSFGKYDVVTIYEGITVEEAEVKAKQIIDLNKTRFKDLEVKLFEGSFVNLDSASVPFKFGVGSGAVPAE